MTLRPSLRDPKTIAGGTDPRGLRFPAKGGLETAGGTSGCDDIRHPRDSRLFQKRLKVHAFEGVQVTDRKKRIVEGVVSNGRVGRVQKLGPIRSEALWKGMPPVLPPRILRPVDPYLVEVADGNHPPRGDSPRFIEIDRDFRRFRALNANGEIRQGLTLHHPENDKGLLRRNFKHPRQTAAADRHQQQVPPHVTLR